MTPSARRVLIIVNPNASRAEAALPELADWFDARCQARMIVGESESHCMDAVGTHGKDSDLIVIGGGDGTVSKLLPRLLPLGLPVAVLPLGTANDLARTLGLPTDPVEAAEIALSGRPHRIDVGLVNDHPFLNVASVGIASNVAKAQNKTLKQIWRAFAYAIGLFSVLRRMKPLFVTIELDGERAWSGPVYQVSVANGRHHGGGLTVAEDAAIDDGVLRLYLVYPGRFWQVAACLIHLKFGLAKPGALKRLNASSVYLHTGRPHPIDADGELATETPAFFEVRKDALTVMVPRTLPAGHGGLSRLGEIPEPIPASETRL
jgi:diacylglycerol kinase (ATP)